MMDVIDVVFYRDAIFEILKGKHMLREVYELRCNLFLLAAHFYFNRIDQNDSDQDNRNVEVLEPFPACFFDFVTKQRRYNDLKRCIANIPDLREINVSFV